MMKWKVVKNTRSASADRSLECFRNDVKSQPEEKSDNNNNVGEDNKDNTSPLKETNKQRDFSLNRQPSVVATDCLNLKSFLGLSRQRSETNLSNLGLIGTESRRSRSEVRGLSCDRLAVGYHTKSKENGHTRSSSPPSKSSCWMRGRKREREFRDTAKNNADVSGKTVVTGSNSKRASSKSRNGESRTIVDGSDGKKKQSSLDLRKSKNCKDIIEEVIYTEIDQDHAPKKVLDVNKEAVKDPKKVIRKKGLAPKPQIATAFFKETSDIEANLNPSGGRKCGSPNSLKQVPQVPPHRKPQRRNQTYNGRNQDRKNDNRIIQIMKLNNLKNNEKDVIKNENIQPRPVIAVAEIHTETVTSELDNQNEWDAFGRVDNVENNNSDNPLPNNYNSGETNVEDRETLPYHIDTPDYSTLDSANCCSFTLTEDLSKEDVVNSNTDCDESIPDTSTVGASENTTSVREMSLSSILRDSTNESKTSDCEPKKTVRFEKLDLIEKYKKHKSDSLMNGNDALGSILDVNSNEIVDAHTLTELLSQCSENSDLATEAVNRAMTVNVFVRNPSPLLSPNHFAVKKSFVITVAKQEKGFRSLCATKNPDTQPEQTKNEQQVSVTFLCSEPPSERSLNSSEENTLKHRSISVSPRRLQQPLQEMTPASYAVRCRSRERRPKERSSSKKNHKTKKKEAPVFVMPQAVIDELSEVLEKRNPPCSAR